MRAFWVRVVVVSSAVVLLGQWAGNGAGTAYAEDGSSAPSSRSTRPVRAVEGGDPASQQLSEVLENQQRILKRLDEIMAELQIVKVRATLR